MNMRIDLGLNSFDFITATSTSDGECMWVYVGVSVRLKGRCPNPNKGGMEGCREEGLEECSVI